MFDRHSDNVITKINLNKDYVIALLYYSSDQDKYLAMKRRVEDMVITANDGREYYMYK